MNVLNSVREWISITSPDGRSQLYNNRDIDTAVRYFNPNTWETGYNFDNCNFKRNCVASLLSSGNLNIAKYPFDLFYINTKSKIADARECLLWCWNEIDLLGILQYSTFTRFETSKEIKESIYVLPIVWSNRLVFMFWSLTSCT